MSKREQISRTEEAPSTFALINLVFVHGKILAQQRKAYLTMDFLQVSVSSQKNSGSVNTDTASAPASWYCLAIST